MKLSQEIPAGEPGYWYLASPFTNYPEGHERAWLDVCRVRGQLLQRGVYSYSPIAESWGAVKQLALPVDHEWWKGDNESKMGPAKGLIMVKLLSWDKSDGMKREWAFFEERKRPIVWCDPDG